MPNNDALIAASSNVLSSAGNSIATSNLNKRNRKFAKEMYGIQRQDALSDWERQNAYNSPAAQMERFKEAGLNPNLIYGQQNTAGSVSPTDFKNPQTDVPRWGDMANGIMQYMDSMYNFEMKQAQTDNLKAQNAVILQEAALKAAQIESTYAGTDYTRVGTDRRRLDLGIETELRETSVDARKEMLRQMQTITDVTSRRDVREALMNSSNLKEASERIKSMVQTRAQQRVQMAHSQADRERILSETDRIKKQIDLMTQDGIIKDLDVYLSKANIRPNDPVWYRSIGLIIDGIIKGIDALPPLTPPWLH